MTQSACEKYPGVISRSRWNFLLFKWEARTQIVSIVSERHVFSLWKTNINWIYDTWSLRKVRREPPWEQLHVCSTGKIICSAWCPAGAAIRHLCSLQNVSHSIWPTAKLASRRARRFQFVGAQHRERDTEKKYPTRASNLIWLVVRGSYWLKNSTPTYALRVCVKVEPNNNHAVAKKWRSLLSSARLLNCGPRSPGDLRPPEVLRHHTLCNMGRRTWMRAINLRTLYFDGYGGFNTDFYCRRQIAHNNCFCRWNWMRAK